MPVPVPPHPHLLHQHQHHQVHGVHHTGDGDCDDIVTEQSFLFQTVTADFPEGVFVRGARRIDGQKKELDDSVEETEVHQNQSLRAVTWVWVIVRPTTLRTSMVYSKVSVKGTNIMKNLFVLDLHYSICPDCQPYSLPHPRASQLSHLQNYSEEDFHNFQFSKKCPKRVTYRHNPHQHCHPLYHLPHPQVCHQYAGTCFCPNW